MFKLKPIQIWGWIFYFPVWISVPKKEKVKTEKEKHEDQLRANNASIVFFAVSLALLVIFFLINGMSIP